MYVAYPDHVDTSQRAPGGSSRTPATTTTSTTCGTSTSQTAAGPSSRPTCRPLRQTCPPPAPTWSSPCWGRWVGLEDAVDGCCNVSRRANPLVRTHSSRTYPGECGPAWTFARFMRGAVNHSLVPRPLPYHPHSITMPPRLHPSPSPSPIIITHTTPTRPHRHRHHHHHALAHHLSPTTHHPPPTPPQRNVIFMHGGYADNDIFADFWYFNITIQTWLHKSQFVYPQYPKVRRWPLARLEMLSLAL